MKSKYMLQNNFETKRKINSSKQAKMSYYEMIVSGMGSLPLPLLIFIPVIVTFYLIWIWVIDDIYNRGGRRIDFFRKLKFWKLASNYLPIQLIQMPGANLDPKKNYLFCISPHGICAIGVCISIGTTAVGFEKMFPHHRPYILTLRQCFKIPILRDVLLAFGMCAASPKSIKWIMTSKNGGNIAVLSPGGAEEAFHSQPGTYRLILKNRQGFVKQALQHGCALVPVFSFGETDLFDQFPFPEHSIVRQIRNLFKRLTGFPAIIPLGGSYLRLPVIPKRKPITVIIGKPIEVDKTENPTTEVINVLHEKFIRELHNLFEENKLQYENNASNTKLVIC